MGQATDALLASDVREEDLTAEQRIKLIEALNLRVRNAESMLERRDRLQEQQATNRIRYRGELINDYATIESRERMNVLDNITKMKVALTDAEKDTFKPRAGVSQGYLDRARFQPGGKRDAIQNLTSSISDRAAIQPGSKISDYEFEHFFDKILQDRESFGMYWDSSANQGKGAVNFEPGVQVSPYAKRQLQAMGERYEQVKEDRNEAQNQVTKEIRRLEALEARVKAQPGKELTDSQLEDVQKELRDASNRANSQLNAQDRKVGEIARQDIDDYLKDDDTYQMLLTELKAVDKKEKGRVMNEPFLQWARSRGLNVGYFGVDGEYIAGQQDDTALAAFSMEAKRGFRNDGSARYFGTGGRTGEMVTIQYKTDKIDNFRDEFGNVHKDEDGNLINAAELRESRDAPVEGALYQTTHDGQTYEILYEGGLISVVDANSKSVKDQDLKAKILRGEMQLTYIVGEDGKPRYTSADDIGGLGKTRTELSASVEDDGARSALDRDFDLIDPSMRVPDGMIRMTESEIQTALREKKGFSVTESAFVLAPNASDMMSGNLGKTRYRTVGGKEVVFADDELMSKEAMGNFRKERATVGELVRLGRDKRSVKRLRRNAEIAASQGNEQAKDWLQQQADLTAKNNEARIEAFEIEQLEAAEELPAPPTAEELAAEEVTAEDEAALRQTLTTRETEDVDLKAGEDEKALVSEDEDPPDPDMDLTPEEVEREAAEAAAVKDFQEEEQPDDKYTGTKEPPPRAERPAGSALGEFGGPKRSRSTFTAGATPGELQAKQDLPPPLPEDLLPDLREEVDLTDPDVWGGPKPEVVDLTDPKAWGTPEVDLTDPKVWGGPKPEAVDLTDPDAWGEPKEVVDLTDPKAWGDPKSREDKIGFFGRKKRERQAKRQAKKDAVADAPQGE